MRRADADLQTRIAALVDALRAVPGGGPEKRDTPAPKFTREHAALFGGADGHYFVIWMRSERPLLTSQNAPSNVPRPAKSDAIPRLRGKFREPFLFAAPVDSVLVGRSIAAEQAEIRRFAIVLLGAGSVTLAAGLFGGWWFTTKAIRPVEDIAATAEQISASDLTRRIDTTDTESELGGLASVLNATFARLDAGQTPLQRAGCDLSAIAEDCLTHIRPLADSRRIEITGDLATASPPPFRTSSTAFTARTAAAPAVTRVSAWPSAKPSSPPTAAALKT